jgi:hypothetical protein
MASRETEDDLASFIVYRRPDGMVMLGLYGGPDQTNWRATLRMTSEQAALMASGLAPPKRRRWWKVTPDGK